MEAEAWNTNADAWVERVREASWHAHDRSIQELLPPPAGLTLDVGCGEGRLTRVLAAAGYDVVGVDHSEALIEIARRAHPHGRYCVAPIDALPAADAAVQLALCINVLPHVVDLAAAARELARVVASGGVLVAGHRHPVAEAGDWDEKQAGLLVRRYFDHEAHTVPLGQGQVLHQQRTIADYIGVLIRAGFALDDIREVPDTTGSVPAFLDLRLVRGDT